jgi:hypothetical protein
MIGIRDRLAADARQRHPRPQGQLGAVELDGRRLAGLAPDLDVRDVRFGRGRRRCRELVQVRDDEPGRPRRVAVADEPRRAGQIIGREQAQVGHGHLRRLRRVATGRIIAIAAGLPVLEHVAHVVLAVAAAPQRRDHAVDLRLAELDVPDQRAPRVEVEIDPIDVNEWRVAIERAAHRQIAHGRVTEPDADRADLDRPAELGAEPIRQPLANLVRAELGIDHGERDQHERAEPADHRAGDPPASRDRR